MDRSSGKHPEADRATQGLSLTLPAKKLKIEKIERQMGEADFWNNRERSQEVVIQLKGLKALLKPLEEAATGADDLATMIEMGDEDAQLAAEVPTATGAWRRCSTIWKSSRC